jgi:hypothetical protein
VHAARYITASVGRHCEADALGLWKRCGLKPNRFGLKQFSFGILMERGLFGKPVSTFPERKAGRVKQDPAMTIYSYRLGRNVIPP